MRTGTNGIAKFSGDCSRKAARVGVFSGLHNDLFYAPEASDTS